MPFGTPLAIVADDRDADLIDDLAMNFFRIGYRLDAVLEKGIEGWSEAGFPTSAYPSVDMMEVLAAASHGSRPVDPGRTRAQRVGQRRDPGIEDRFRGRAGGSSKGSAGRLVSAAESERLTVACHGGARAAVAASFLARLDIPVRAVLGGGVPDAVAVPSFTSASS